MFRTDGYVSGSLHLPLRSYEEPALGKTHRANILPESNKRTIETEGSAFSKYYSWWRPCADDPKP